VWTTLEEEVYATSYTFVSAVVTGITYNFRVSARNSVGYSAYSDEL